MSTSIPYKGPGFAFETLKPPVNDNAANPALPNTGPPPSSDIVFNSAIPQHGGGSRGMHRQGCLCSDCKKMRGGGGAYPNGLVGSSWTSNIKSWPGVNGVSGDSNHYPINQYHTDVQRDIKYTGSAPPFLGGGGGGGRHRRTRKRRHVCQTCGSPLDALGSLFKGGSSGGTRRRRHRRRANKHRAGGGMTNFIGQDLMNIGRQIEFNAGNAYNTIMGYNAPVNPLPWVGQGR